MTDAEILKLLMNNPSNYQVTVYNDDVRVYDKSNGESYNMKQEAAYVLVELLNARGVEAEHL